MSKKSFFKVTTLRRVRAIPIKPKSKNEEPETVNYNIYGPEYLRPHE